MSSLHDQPHLPELFKLEMFEGPVSEPLFSSYSHSYGDFIQTLGFKYHLYNNNLIYISSLGLSPKL